MLYILELPCASLPFGKDADRYHGIITTKGEHNTANKAIQLKYISNNITDERALLSEVKRRSITSFEVTNREEFTQKDLQNTCKHQLEVNTNGMMIGDRRHLTNCYCYNFEPEFGGLELLCRTLLSIRKLEVPFIIRQFEHPIDLYQYLNGRSGLRQMTEKTLRQFKDDVENNPDNYFSESTGFAKIASIDEQIDLDPQLSHLIQ